MPWRSPAAGLFGDAEHSQPSPGIVSSQPKHLDAQRQQHGLRRVHTHYDILKVARDAPPAPANVPLSMPIPQPRPHFRRNWFAYALLFAGLLALASIFSRHDTSNAPKASSSSSPVVPPTVGVLAPGAERTAVVRAQRTPAPTPAPASEKPSLPTQNRTNITDHPASVTAAATQGWTGRCAPDHGDDVG